MTQADPVPTTSPNRAALLARARTAEQDFGVTTTMAVCASHEVKSISELSDAALTGFAAFYERHKADAGQPIAWPWDEQNPNGTYKYGD